MDKVIGKKLIDSNGKEMFTKSFTGPNMIIGLLFAWSESMACQVQIPKVINFFKQYHGNKHFSKNFHLIMIAEEISYEAWNKYRQEIRIPIVPYAETLKLKSKFKDVTGYPTLQLYNSETGELLENNIIDDILQNRTIPFLSISEDLDMSQRMCTSENNF